MAYSAIEPAKGFWEERKAARERLASDSSSVKVPLPASGGVTLLAQLPALELNLLPGSGQHPVLSVPFQTPLKPASPRPAFLAGRPAPRWLEALPASYVSVKDLYLPENYKPGDPMVIHIQDAHGNVEAQRNIARAIQSLTKPDPKLPAVPILIGIEGAKGPFNFAPYRSFPDKENTQQIADYFLKEGFITGPEHVGMTSAETPLFWGVENESLYLAHVQALKDSVAGQKEAQEEIERIAGRLEAVKDKVLNPALRELDSRISLHHKGKIGLGKHLKFLASKSSPPAVKKFLTALDLEDSLDYKKVEGERSFLTRALAGELPKAELENLVKAGLAYRLGNLSHGAFYQYLKDLCSAYGIKLSKWPEMDKYIRYVLLSEKIRAEDLLAEVEGLEKKAVARAIRNDRELEIMEKSRNLALAEKLVKFELSPEEWDRYAERKKHVYRLFDNGREPVGNGRDHSLPGFLQPFEQFNEAAILRNDVMVKNLLEKASATSPQPAPLHGEGEYNQAVLVTGGFHTVGITQILKDKNVAYAVLSPRLGKVEGSGSEYLDIFTRDKTPLEKLFTGERLTLAGAPHMAASIGPTTSNGIALVEGNFVGFQALMKLARALKTVINDTAARSGIIEAIGKDLAKQVDGARFLTLRKVEISDVAFSEDPAVDQPLKTVRINYSNEINGNEVQSSAVFSVNASEEQAQSGRIATAHVNGLNIGISQGAPGILAGLVRRTRQAVGGTWRFAGSLLNQATSRISSLRFARKAEGVYSIGASIKDAIVTLPKLAWVWARAHANTRNLAMAASAIFLLALTPALASAGPVLNQLPVQEIAQQAQNGNLWGTAFTLLAMLGIGIPLIVGQTDSQDNHMQLAKAYDVDPDYLQFLNDDAVKFDLEYGRENPGYAQRNQLMLNIKNRPVIYRGDYLSNIISALLGMNGYLGTAEERASHLTSDPEVANTYGKGDDKFFLEFDLRKLGIRQRHMFIRSTRMYHSEDSVMGPRADLRTLTEENKRKLIQRIETTDLDPVNKQRIYDILNQPLDRDTPAAALRVFRLVLERLENDSDEMYKFWIFFFKGNNGSAELKTKLQKLAEQYGFDSKELMGLEGTSAESILYYGFSRDEVKYFEARMKSENEEISERIYSKSYTLLLLYLVNQVVTGKNALILSTKKNASFPTDPSQYSRDFFKNEGSYFDPSSKSELASISALNIDNRTPEQLLAIEKNLDLNIRTLTERLAKPAEPPAPASGSGLPWSKIVLAFILIPLVPALASAGPVLNQLPVHEIAQQAQNGNLWGAAMAVLAGLGIGIPLMAWHGKKSSALPSADHIDHPDFPGTPIRYAKEDIEALGRLLESPNVVLEIRGAPGSGKSKLLSAMRGGLPGVKRKNILFLQAAILWDFFESIKYTQVENGKALEELKSNYPLYAGMVSDGQLIQLIKQNSKMKYTDFLEAYLRLALTGRYSAIVYLNDIHSNDLAIALQNADLINNPFIMHAVTVDVAKNGKRELIFSPPASLTSRLPWRKIVLALLLIPLTPALVAAAPVLNQVPIQEIARQVQDGNLWGITLAVGGQDLWGLGIFAIGMAAAHINKHRRKSQGGILPLMGIIETANLEEEKAKARLAMHYLKKLLDEVNAFRKHHSTTGRGDLASMADGAITYLSRLQSGAQQTADPMEHIRKSLLGLSAKKEKFAPILARHPMLILIRRLAARQAPPAFSSYFNEGQELDPNEKLLKRLADLGLEKWGPLGEAVHVELRLALEKQGQDGKLAIMLENLEKMSDRIREAAVYRLASQIIEKQDVAESLVQDENKRKWLSGTYTRQPLAYRRSDMMVYELFDAMGIKEYTHEEMIAVFHLTMPKSITDTRLFGRGPARRSGIDYGIADSLWPDLFTEEKTAQPRASAIPGKTPSADEDPIKWKKERSLELQKEAMKERKVTGNFLRAYELYALALSIDPSNENIKREMAKIEEKARQQGQVKENYQDARDRARQDVARVPLKDILDQIASAVVQGDGLLVHALIIELLSSSKSQSLTLDDLILVNVNFRYSSSWEIKHDRQIALTLDFRIRLRIALAAIKGLRIGSRAEREALRLFLHRFNAPPESLREELLKLMPKADAEAALLSFNIGKSGWEDTEERLAFKMNLLLDKKPDAVISHRAVRNSLSNLPKFIAWLSGRPQAHRLSLAEKMQVIEQIIQDTKKSGEILSARETEIRQAVAEIHFKDRYDIDLEIPLAGEPRLLELPLDGDNQPLELFGKDDLEHLIKHLSVIDAELRRMPYTFTGANKEVRRLILAKRGRAEYLARQRRVFSESPDKSTILLFLPSKPGKDRAADEANQEMYSNTLIHEMGHGVGGHYMGVSFIYSVLRLQDWMRKNKIDVAQGVAMAKIALDEYRAEEESGLREAGNAASQLLYLVIDHVYQERRQKYEDARKRALSEVARLSLKLIQIRFGFPDPKPTNEDASKLVDSYLSGENPDDQYGYIQDFLQMNPNAAQSLRSNPAAANWLLQIRDALSARVALQVSPLADIQSLSHHDVGNDLAVDYVYRVPRQDGGRLGTQERDLPNEFIAEYTRLFFRFHEQFRAAEPELFELFAVLFDASNRAPPVISKRTASLSSWIGNIGKAVFLLLFLPVLATAATHGVLEAPSSPLLQWAYVLIVGMAAAALGGSEGKSASYDWAEIFSESGLRHKGKNEDAALAGHIDGIRVAAVFDGVGNSNGGLASAYFKDRLLAVLKGHGIEDEDLKKISGKEFDAEILDVLITAVKEIRAQMSKEIASATTATVALLVPSRDGSGAEKAYILNAGDTRAYARQPDGRLEPLTIDNLLPPDNGLDELIMDLDEKPTLVTDLIENGPQAFLSRVEDASQLDATPIKDFIGLETTRNALFNSRHFAINALSTEQEYKTVVTVVTLPQGSELLLVSDGVTDNLTDKEIASAKNAKELGERARARSLDKGHVRHKDDDITAVVVKIGKDAPRDINASDGLLPPIKGGILKEEVIEEYYKNMGRSRNQDKNPQEFVITKSREFSAEAVEIGSHISRNDAQRVLALDVSDGLNAAQLSMLKKVLTQHRADGGQRKLHITLHAQQGVSVGYDSLRPTLDRLIKGDKDMNVEIHWGIITSKSILSDDLEGVHSRTLETLNIGNTGAWVEFLGPESLAYLYKDGQNFAQILYNIIGGSLLLRQAPLDGTIRGIELIKRSA